MTENGKVERPDFTDRISATVISALSIMIVLLYYLEPRIERKSAILILSTIIILNHLIRRQLDQLFEAVKDPKKSGDTAQEEQIYKALKSRNQLERVLNTYLPHISLDAPFAEPTLRTFNIVFLDLRNFTKFSADSTLARVTLLINDFYAVISRNVAQHHGIISAFLGDGAMLLFENTHDAISCVEGIKCQLPPDLQLCAGIHKGEAAYGCFGKEHCSFTVIGDAVNTASRVEASTRALGCWFLCSNAISWPNTRLAGTVELKGKGSMELYEVCDPEIAALTREIEICEKMMEFQAAVEVCKRALRTYQDDQIFQEKYKNNVQRANEFVIDLPNIDELESSIESE